VGQATGSNGQVFLRNANVLQNICTGQAGGGVYNSGCWFQMDGGTMGQNQVTAAGSSGGGIQNSGTALFLNMTFDTNSAVSYGGAVNAAAMTTILTGCTFVGNNSAATGPKVAELAGAVVTATNCTNLAPDDIVVYQPGINPG
jgi:hypothetical protein